MARLIQAANTGENKEQLDDFTPIPAGKYVAQIKKSEFKATKAKTGHYLKLEFSIIDGEYKGRKLWENLNLDNPNPVAVEIANKTLNTICQACNKSGVQDSEELHGIPILITVKVNPASALHPASNSIKFYESIDAAQQPKENVDTETNAAEKTKPTKLPWE